MLNLEHLQAFVRVAELGSFTRAAEQLACPKARVSLHVRSLERTVGARLLQRTTRSVRLTHDGERLLDEARDLLGRSERVTGLLRGREALRGRVRIDAPVAMTRSGIVPRLPELLARHPGLELDLSASDRWSAVVQEGFDVVVRVGVLRDSALSVRRLGAFTMVNCASPAYLARRGTPRKIDDLEGHLVVHYASPAAGTPSFEHRRGARYVDRPMQSQITVRDTDSYLAACLAGLGIVQVPRYGIRDRLASGELVEVLPDHPAAPLPVSLLHPHGRQVPERVRVVLDFLRDVLAPLFTAR